MPRTPIDPDFDRRALAPVIATLETVIAREDYAPQTVARAFACYLDRMTTEGRVAAYRSHWAAMAAAIRAECDRLPVF